jgi:hypothetical protein
MNADRPARKLGQRGTAGARLLCFLCCMLLWGAAGPPVTPQPLLAAAHEFAGPVHGGCYLVAENSCRLTLDKWSPLPAALTPPAALQLRANGRLLYDYHFDRLKPPAAGYVLSTPRLGFAARCGRSYTLELWTKPQGESPAWQQLGATGAFAWPTSPGHPPADDLYLPAMSGK